MTLSYLNSSSSRNDEEVQGCFSFEDVSGGFEMHTNHEPLMTTLIKHLNKTKELLYSKQALVLLITGTVSRFQCMLKGPTVVVCSYGNHCMITFGVSSSQCMCYLDSEAACCFSVSRGLFTDSTSITL